MSKDVSTWKDVSVEDDVYPLSGKYDVTREEGSYYVFTPTKKAEDTIRQIYIRIDDKLFSGSHRYFLDHKYLLSDKYLIRWEKGTYYVFTPTEDNKPAIPTYVPADVIQYIEGFGQRNNIKKGGGKKMTKKAKRRANSTRRR